MCPCAADGGGVRPIFLIGFMAAGKTTLGRPLAATLGRPFVDTDAAVEAAAGRTVREIFDTAGEEAFRRMEREALMRAAADGAVVACGGGTPCHAGNMDFMLERGLVVELRASMEATLRRLRQAPGQRPLVDALLGNPEALKARVEEMQESRRPFYCRAHASFASDLLETADEIDRSVKDFIAAFQLR